MTGDGDGARGRLSAVAIRRIPAVTRVLKVIEVTELERRIAELEQAATTVDLGGRRR